MNRFLLYAGALAVFLFAGVLPLWAKEAIPTVDPTKKMDQIDARLTKIPERITDVVAKITGREEKKEDHQATLIERKQQALKIAEDKLKLLDDIWARVQSRIKKMQDSGIDVSGIQVKIKDVTTKRQAAADALSQAQAAILAEATPGTPVQKPKVQRLKLVPALRAYHQSIVAVITSLIELTKHAKILPTMTVTPTSAPAT